MYSAQLKTMIALEVLVKNRPLSDVAQQYGLSFSVLGEWCEKIFSSTPAIFSKTLATQIAKNAELKSGLSTTQTCKRCGNKNICTKRSYKNFNLLKAAV